MVADAAGLVEVTACAVAAGSGGVAEGIDGSGDASAGWVSVTGGAVVAGGVGVATPSGDPKIAVRVAKRDSTSVALGS